MRGGRALARACELRHSLRDQRLEVTVLSELFSTRYSTNGLAITGAYLTGRRFTACDVATVARPSRDRPRRAKLEKLGGHEGRLSWPGGDLTDLSCQKAASRHGRANALPLRLLLQIPCQFVKPLEGRHSCGCVAVLIGFQVRGTKANLIAQ